MSTKTKTGTPVRFVADDPYGAWKKDELAMELGPETPGIPELLMLRLARGEILSITDPYGRGLIEEVKL